MNVRKLLSPMLDKLKRIPLFVKIWLFHLIIYFLLLSILLYIRDYNDSDGFFNQPLLLLLIKAPVIGLYGLLDGIGFLVFITIIIMYFINLYIKKTFLSYVLSIILTYSVFLYYCNDGYGIYIFTIISLLLTVILNKIIFHRKFTTI